MPAACSCFRLCVCMYVYVCVCELRANEGILNRREKNGEIGYKRIKSVFLANAKIASDLFINLFVEFLFSGESLFATNHLPSIQHISLRLKIENISIIINHDGNQMDTMECSDASSAGGVLGQFCHIYRIDLWATLYNFNLLFVGKLL